MKMVTNHFIKRIYKHFSPSRADWVDTKKVRERTCRKFETCTHITIQNFDGSSIGVREGKLCYCVNIYLHLLWTRNRTKRLRTCTLRFLFSISESSRMNFVFHLHFSNYKSMMMAIFPIIGSMFHRMVQISCSYYYPNRHMLNPFQTSFLLQGARIFTWNCSKNIFREHHHCYDYFSTTDAW